MRTLLAITLCTALGVSFTTTAQSEEAASPWAYSVSTDIYSDYMFRGFNMYEGVSVQPSVEVGYADANLGSLGVNVWSHLPADSDKESGEFAEVDYSLTYSKDVGDFNLSLGYVQYTYPRKDGFVIEETGEVAASVAWNTFLTPTLTVMSDIDAYDYEYYELGFSHELELAALGNGFKINPFLAFGFASNSEKVYADDGLVQVTYGFEMPMKSGDLDVTPSFNMTHGVDDLTTTNFWFGVSFGYAG